MGTYSFKFQCSCPKAPTLISILGANAQAWKDDAALGGHSLECKECGRSYRTVDDGMPVSVGGGIKARDESRPRIDTLSINAGPVSGGTVVRITGHAFSHAAPSVIFGGVPSKFVTVISDTTLETVVPPGAVRANIKSGPYVNISHGTVNRGPFQIGELIVGDRTNASAVVTSVGPAFLLVSNLSASFGASETITGGSSGATSVFKSLTLPSFTLEESVVGLTSNQSGFISEASSMGYLGRNLPISIKALSGPLIPGEEIFGSLSGARARLDDVAPIIGAVDVEIRNIWGIRANGSKLTAGFTYSV